MALILTDILYFDTLANQPLSISSAYLHLQWLERNKRPAGQQVAGPLGELYVLSAA